MENHIIFIVLFVILPVITGPLSQEEFETTLEYFRQDVHSRERRARRNFVVRCCGRKKSCTGPKRGRGRWRGGTRRTTMGTLTTQTDFSGDINTGDQGPPISCAQLNFGNLASCCELHPTIFEYMDPDIRNCANRTSTDSDFGYYKSILKDYMLNQAVTMKNKLDLRRIPNAVKFYDCFFKERDWIAQGDRGEIFNPGMVDEFIDNIDASWDDLLTDALTNCSKVIKSVVPWPYMQLSTREDSTTRQVYQTYPILVSQCMRKVLLSYCPVPNKPLITPVCNELRAKFRVCDPFQQTADPPEEDEYDEENPEYEGEASTPPNEDDYYYDDNEGAISPNTSPAPGGTGDDEEYYDEEQ